MRYGGPLLFADRHNYCLELSKNDVIQKGRLVPYDLVKDLDIPLYLRSIWWYFRLKRYGNRLCIEVRPLARQSDELLASQLRLTLDAMNL